MIKSQMIATIFMAAFCFCGNLAAQVPPPGTPTFVGVPPFTDDRWVTSDVGTYIPWDVTYSKHITVSGPAGRSGDIYDVGQKSLLQIVVPNHYQTGAPVSHTIRFWILGGQQDPEDTYEFLINGIVMTNMNPPGAWGQVEVIQPAYVGSNTTSTLSWLTTKKQYNGGRPNWQYLDAVEYVPNYTNAPSVNGPTNTHVFMSMVSLNVYKVSWLNSVHSNQTLRVGVSLSSITNVVTNTPTLASGLWSVMVTNDGSAVKFFTPR